jgi:hypothetical protein
MAEMTHFPELGRHLEQLTMGIGEDTLISARLSARAR